MVCLREASKKAGVDPVKAAEAEQRHLQENRIARTSRIMSIERSVTGRFILHLVRSTPPEGMEDTNAVLLLIPSSPGA